MVEKFVQLLNGWWYYRYYQLIFTLSLSVIPVSQAGKRVEFTKGIVIVCYHYHCCYGYVI